MNLTNQLNSFKLGVKHLSPHLVPYKTVKKPKQIKRKKRFRNPHNTQVWKGYRKYVWELTKKIDVSNLANFDKRGFKGYHLDHKISIWFGYKNNVNPIDIAKIDNLRFIHYKENMVKGTRILVDDKNRYLLTNRQLFLPMLY